MNERVTCIALFNDESIEKINKLVEDLEKPLCKVPYGKKVDDRLKCDSLPYHFTLCAWPIAKEKEVIETLKEMKFPPFRVLVEKVSIKEGNEDSLEVRFAVAKNEELYKLQDYLFERVQNSYYNPDTFQFHITIHCDKDHSKILRMKDQLAKDFHPFELEITKFGLFEIYPAKKVLEMNSTN